MTVNEDSISEGDEFAKDKRMKKTLLIETITTECASSTHDILQRIHAAIGEGFKLEATVLSGGYTNYSYKVYVDKQPELCVFAKLSFEYALWNPDRLVIMICKGRLMNTRSWLPAITQLLIVL
eukprot:995794_1